jgi:peptidoglycan/xylan/chitin deacetylase (PgdA/CDA1 family)
MRFRWPDGNMCAVSFTFDVDGETIPFVMDKANAHRRLTLLSQSAYGPNVGAPRILDMLACNDLKASFFIPGFTAELHEDLLQRMLEEGHEIGHHGYFHERPDSLSDDEEEAVLVRGIEALERITGSKPIGYRSPSWELKPSTPALLRKHGFLYDSSLMGDDIPHKVEAGDGELIELPVQWILDDFPFLGLVPPAMGIASPEQVFDVWKEEFDAMVGENSIFVLTCHPFVSGRPSRVALLERLVRHMREVPGVWFATLEEIARYCADNDVCALQRFPPEFAEQAARFAAESST